MAKFQTDPECIKQCEYVNITAYKNQDILTKADHLL